MTDNLRRLATRTARAAAKTGFAFADLAFGQLRGPRILIYHQIGGGLGRQMEVTAHDFATQIEWLMKHQRVVDLDTAIAQRGLPEAAELVTLSFDDGYEDFYRLGFPLLRVHQLPFVLYLTTQPVETGQPLGPPQAAPLSWRQIEEMMNSGLMTLGAHTHRHHDLRYTEPGVLADDLATCDSLIERRLGVVPRHFAYPYGYWSESADVEVRKRYGSAVLGGGLPITAATDPFLLHRLPIQLSDGMLFFRRKLRRGMRLEESSRRALTGYRGP